MNKDIQEKAVLLNEWILNNEVVKEYKKYESLISLNPELLEKEKRLKDMQQEIVINKHKNIDCSRLVETYEKELKDFQENPIIYNYLTLKQEVNDLLINIQEDIKNQLKNMLTDE